MEKIGNRLVFLGFYSIFRLFSRWVEYKGYINGQSLQNEEGHNLMNTRDPKVQEDIQIMLKDVEKISDDLTSYFYYHQNRTPLVEQMLSESGQN